MWGIFIGIAIGILQVLAIGMIGRLFVRNGFIVKLLSCVLFIAKMAAIIAILYFISTISLTHLIWAAGGMLLGLVAASVFLVKKRNKQQRGQS